MLLRTVVFIAISMIPTLIGAQAPVCADKVLGRNCCGATVIDQCPVQGCGGDPRLNRKKNKTSKPTAASIDALTFLQLASFKFPKAQDWHDGDKRTQLETWGEGRAIQLKGFLIHAENYTDGAETTNCNLRTNDYNDWHLVLVQDLTLANKWKTADDKARATPDLPKVKKKAAEDRAKAAYKRAEKRSLTAEITPRLRLDGWTIAKLRELARGFTYVRVTGWAMLDTQHLSNPINRLSNWEIHPVSKFEVCTATVTECDNDQGWDKLEDVQ